MLLKADVLSVVYGNRHAKVSLRAHIVNHIKVTGIKMIISAKSEQLPAKNDQGINKRLEFGFDDTTVFLFMCLLALTIV